LENARQTLKDYLRQSAGNAESELPLTREVRSLVEKHLNDHQMSVEKLAHLTRKSRAALYRELAKETGKTPHQFIRDIRLEAACRLLLSTSLGVAEIAYQTGFNDPSYFSKIFTERFYMPPTAFRSQSSEPD
jgi:AraC-like DNA-binding protein